MKKKLKTLFPYFLLAVAIIVVYKVINELSFFFDAVVWIWTVISPFFFGFLVAYVMNIPCVGIQVLLEKSKIKFICKRKKALSIILVYLVLVMLVLTVLYLVIPAIYRSASSFITNLPSYYEGMLDFVDSVNDLGLVGLHISGDGITATLQNLIDGISIESLASPINALFGVASVLFSVLLAFISSIYFLIDKEKITSFLRRLLRVITSSGVYSAIMEYANKLNNNFKQYIFTQTIDGCILGTIVAIELLIIGSPYALILGIMFWIVNYVPFFGSYISTFVAVIVVAFTQGMSTALITAVVLVVTHLIDSNIIQPKLMSGTFSLSPLLVIISLTFGGAVAGILGMIIAIPITAIVKDLIESIIAYRERKRVNASDEMSETESLK